MNEKAVKGAKTLIFLLLMFIGDHDLAEDFYSYLEKKFNIPRKEAEYLIDLVINDFVLAD